MKNKDRFVPEFYNDFKIDQMIEEIEGRYKKFTTSADPKYIMQSVIMHIDATLVGTPYYMGIASFWNTEYKFTMRETTKSVLIKIHNAFLENNLDVSGQSDKHQQIIDKYIKKYDKSFDTRLSKKYG